MCFQRSFQRGWRSSRAAGFAIPAASASGKCGRSPDSTRSPRRFGPRRVRMTTPGRAGTVTLRERDEPTRALVRVAAVVTAGTEEEVRAALSDASRVVPHPWIEELLLQTYLFAGFPRALNAFREWRRFAPVPHESAAPAPDVKTWLERGTATCRAVYGAMYDKLRRNIDALHPALDSWMIVEGYGT